MGPNRSEGKNMNIAKTISLSLCAASTLAFTSAAHAGALSYVLHMNNDPVVEGWSLVSSAGSHSVSSGILSINTPEYREFFSPGALWNDTVSNAAGWQVGARVRLTTPGESANSRVELFMMDDVNFNRLEIFQDRVELRSSFTTQTYFMNTVTDFHAYEVVAQGTNTKLFVDNVERLSIDWTTPAAATFAMVFGDGHGSYPSTSEWDYVSIRHSIPTPGSAAIMALAFSSLTRRRRR